MVFAHWVKDMEGRLVRIWGDEDKMEVSPELSGEISPFVKSGANAEEGIARREHLVLIWANPKRHASRLQHAALQAVVR